MLRAAVLSQDHNKFMYAEAKCYIYAKLAVFIIIPTNCHTTTVSLKKKSAPNSTCPVRKTRMSPGFWVMWICSTDTTHASR